MLNIEKLPKPPAFLLASKIICDLQLPNELEVNVKTLDRIINQDDNDAEWKTVLFGNRIPNPGCHEIGTWIRRNDRISDFATKVNNLLKLKPSSSFASKQQGVENENNRETSQGIKTPFVRKEWVRFIEYRRNVIDRTHVPTAIRKGIVKKMDPAYVYQFAQTEGFYHYNRPTTELSEIDRSILEVFEKASKRFPSPPGPPKRIPRFRSSLFGLQGLADQLLEFDPSEYGQLKQEFSTSSLVFARKPKLLAAALKKANPPHLLNIHKGPALKDRKFVMTLITSRCGISKSSSQMDRYAWKIVTVESELDEFYDSQSRPSLLLHDPSFGYWISALRLELVTFVDWNLFSASLPSSFLWLLQLICEGIEESPRDFYPTFNAVEAIVFLGHTDVKRNITGNQQLYNALRAEF
ncbi:hypothetical protein DAPPUDRAFT_117456 [Daphnia pulex]|uniref:Uncharacterized protein n=1 Tax=Daphnia pulex TaxID=6669 RepID=E9HSQ2_DAPPU|nr:hypothetical protein DAPPUDRAFT_117456 [Daphnia pulex]|eukprot:EFX65232.1 hypothetical protein DAPPUDRAFT_117456 [Daphnia pulex]